MYGERTVGWQLDSFRFSCFLFEGNILSPLLTENSIVHTLWIGGQLSLMEQLTIKLLQSHGHQVHLWSYDKPKGVPDGTILRNATEILPASSIFRFTGKPLRLIPNGGIGSLSHWSDQFQVRLLHQEGGINVQLDVACLKPLNFENEYAFASLPLSGRIWPFKILGIAPFVMKCPAGSPFAASCAAYLASRINEQTIGHLDWNSSMREIGRQHRKYFPFSSRQILNSRLYMDLGCLSKGPFFEATEIPEEVIMIHWSNATHVGRKSDPIPGSVYHQLLKQMKLV